MNYLKTSWFHGFKARASFLDYELENISELRKEFDVIALKRAEILIDAHERFRKVLGGKRFKVVKPVLPMDLMGVYILLPDRGKLMDIKA